MEPERYSRLRQSKIPLHSREKLRGSIPGEWASIFAGEGIEFSAIKPFEPGDDLRDLDLHELAKSGEEEIIQRVVGRQLRVNIWADWSGSMQRSGGMLFQARPEIRDTAIGLLLFSALNVYSPVGFCAFNRECRLFPENSGENHCAEVWDWITGPAQGDGGGAADMPRALTSMMSNASPQSLVFLVSDYQDPAFEGDFAEMLRPAANRFDLVAVVIRDPLECRGSIKWPVCVAVKDSEGRGTSEVYLTPRRLRELQDASARHLAGLEQNFHKAGVDHVVLDSSSIEDCQRALAGFFEDRKRTRG